MDFVDKRGSCFCTPVSSKSGFAPKVAKGQAGIMVRCLGQNGYKSRVNHSEDVYPKRKPVKPVRPMACK